MIVVYTLIFWLVCLMIAMYVAGQQAESKSTGRPSWVKGFLFSLPSLGIILLMIDSFLAGQLWAGFAWLFCYLYSVIVFAVMPNRFPQVSLAKHVLGTILWPFRVSIEIVRGETEEENEAEELVDSLIELDKASTLEE